MMGQTPLSLHGFQSRLSEAKPPSSTVVSPDHGLLGLWRADMRGSFSSSVPSSSATFKQTFRGGEINVVASLCLVPWSWKRMPKPHLSSTFSQSILQRQPKFLLIFGRSCTVFSLLYSISAGDQSDVCQQSRGTEG